MKKIQLGGHLKGSEIRGYAIVDNEDFEWLNQRNWYYNKGYAVGEFSHNKNSRKYIFLHRLIMSTPKGMDTDHINGNGLDNRRSNLRICTHSQNLMNSKKALDNKSGYKGVYWNKNANKWLVRIIKDYKNIYLGMFDNKIEAAKAYNQKAKKLFGEFAYLNIL